MTMSLIKQVSEKELAAFEKRLSAEIAMLKDGISTIQSDFDTGKIAIGVYANGCNTIFNEFIQKLQEQEGKDIWLMGGGIFLNSLLENDVVIDELLLFIIPIILGKGIPLFRPSNKKLRLKLDDAFLYDNDVVKMHYVMQ